MATAQQRALFEQQLDWARQQRDEAKKALDLYERGTMRFSINGTDVTHEQMASLRNVIKNMEDLSERLEAHLA